MLCTLGPKAVIKLCVFFQSEKKGNALHSLNKHLSTMPNIVQDFQIPNLWDFVFYSLICLQITFHNLSPGMILLKVSFLNIPQKIPLGQHMLSFWKQFALLTLPNDALWQNIKPGSCLISFWQLLELPAKSSSPTMSQHSGSFYESTGMTQDKLRVGETSSGWLTAVITKMKSYFVK